MEPKYDIHIMVQVAQMYYMDGFTQEKIANQLGISRSSVSMILSEARDFGIVDIRIKNPQTNNDELSEKIMQTFGVPKCYVIPINAKLVRILTKIVATQGAFIAEKEIKSDKMAERQEKAVFLSAKHIFLARSFLNTL